MKKYGFSLIEVLLVLGIIAVVTAMGFSISQRGMEKAYNQYWYTGFKALWDATNDYDAGRTDRTKLNPDQYANHIKGMINGAQIDTTTRKITTPNGIMYTVGYNNQLRIAPVTTTIPGTKQSQSRLNETQFIYYFTENSMVLCPVAPPATNYIDLRNRKDILPFYVKGTDNNNGVYSFREAYCIVNGTTNIVTDCSGITTLNQGGIIYPANPRKVY